MELSKQEITVIKYYKNFHLNSEIKFLDNSSKEKTWIQIYKKLPIDSSISALLFINIDESTILNELESLVTDISK